MNLKIAQVIGLNTDQKAAQVLSLQREEITFLAVLQLSCDDAFTKGRLALSELSDFYFEFEGSVSEKLNATFEEALKKFSSFEFDLVLSVASGKTFYLIGQGEIEVYLNRNGKISSLLSVGAPKQLISGFLEPSDRLLLSTKSLITFLGDDLTKSLNMSPEVFEEEISARVGAGTAEGEGLAALAIELESEGKENVIPNLPSDEAQYEKEQAVYEPKTSPVFKNIFISILSFLKIFTKIFPKSGRGRLILAFLLLIIIGGGIGFKYQSDRNAQKQAQFNQILQNAKDDFQTAKGLFSLNPVEAKNKLDSAKNKINTALSLFPNNQEAKDFKKSIEDESSSILQQFEASEFPLFLDLDLIKKDFKAQNLTLSAGKILLLDPDTKTLVSIDLAKKSQQILAGNDKLGEAQLASLNGSLAFVFSKDKGIIKIDTANQKDTSVAKVDEEWAEIKDLAGFAGNVYLLDMIKNQIWKYLPTSSGYSDKREYLSSDTKADLSQSIRMQIESSIYVLKSGGEMLRFTKGNKDTFGYEGLDKGVKDPKSFFVSSETDNLYLLDSGNSRLLILTKTGSYKGQISGNKFGTSSDLVVDEKGKKVYLLEGSKIYSVDLK